LFRAATAVLERQMQHGYMERLNRKRGPEVWQFRWSEIDPGGKRLYHKKIVGTLKIQAGS
jgi:integrase